MGVYVIPIETTEDSLEVIGGKGRSLARLSVAGFPVPGGFQVTAAAYKNFIAENGLASQILELAKPALVEGAVSFEHASSSIRKLFSEIALSEVVANGIKDAYAALDDRPAVAVRSSANAEDLPDLSFAGQQETYLNVRGADAVVAAVRNCWSSLWTAQAINYRHEMGVEHDVVAMAVVVQIMVPSDVSGILFTANPATGDRTEMIVNGSFGLGEAVVSGQVTPDTYFVDKETLTVKDTLIGAKEQMIVSDGERGTRFEAVTDGQRGTSSLSDSTLTELASLAIKVEGHFGGVPQDIEWAVAGGKLYLLQSRPITNLPPAPLRDVRWEAVPNAQLIKRQVAENMPDPLSPLFESLYLPALHDAQVWPNHKNFVVVTVNGYAYQRIDDEGFEVAAAEEARPLVSRIPAIIKGYYRFYTQSISNWKNRELPAYLGKIDEWRQIEPGAASDEQIMQGIRDLTNADAKYWMALRNVIGVAKMTDGGLQGFLEAFAPDQGFISGTFLSGFDSTTLHAETDMRAMAERIQSNEALSKLVRTTPASRLLSALQQHPEGQAVCSAIERYLSAYGNQIYNLDFVEPAQAEDPIPFVMSLKALVQHGGYELTDRQAEVARQRKAKLKEANRFFRGRLWWKWRYLLWLARHYYPTREEALFFMGAAWAVLRPLALELGRRLVEVGTVSSPDDVFYLASAELEQAIAARKENKAIPELRRLAAGNRELRQARFRLDQPQAIPPMTDQDSSPYSTVRENTDDDHVLRGFAVSPGTVTGEVSVILSPNDFDKMKPGTILVCPLTTPAWTQLFPHSIGLVTDIGSILAHGSIVAREYGIPAVLGVGDITRRVKSGQRITIEGDRGIVRIEEVATATV